MSSSTLPKSFITLGVLGAVAVSLGALGAHFLKNQIPSGKMTADLLDGFDKGVRYHFYHLLAMFACTLLSFQYTNRYLKLAYTFFFWGIILFSGSLYFLCTRHLLGMEFLKVLGPITPIGGILFIAGWLMLVVGVYRR
jgi:uncharacterized membrane protein YgdD (TMEM256/DUF423 family)